MSDENCGVKKLKLFNLATFGLLLGRRLASFIG